MFVKRFELHLCKPLLHNHTKHIVIEDLSQISVLIAPNGFGKSTILREMTPYPACRTDYEKNGKKVIELEHERSYYILTSDFSKAAGAHSFIKDDVELNPSGTTEVQESLVEQHFGYTGVIDKLLSGEYQICSMTAAARKELIYNTYPVSLMFILEKYTKLKSNLRVLSNQLKMLNERKLSLTDLILKEDTLEHYNGYRKALSDALAAIDKEMYAFSKVDEDIKRQANQILQKHNLTNPESFLEDIISECKDLSWQMFELSINQSVELVLPERLERLIGSLTAHLTSLTDKKTEKNSQGIKLSEEISKLRTALNNDTASAIKECERLIETQEEIIKANTIDDDTPVVDLDESELMEQHRERISQDLMMLHGIEELVTHKRFNDLIAEQALKQAEVSRITTELEKYQQLATIQDHKLVSLRDKHSYPLDCVRSCKLRENLQSVINSMEVELAETRESIATLTKKLNDAKTRLDKINSVVEPQRAARPILMKIETLFARKTWGDFVCSGLEPLEAIKQDVTKIINRYVKVIAKSEAHARVKEATTKLTGLKAKLVGLKASDQPVKEYLTQSLVQKEYDLTCIGEELSKLDVEIAKDTTHLTVYKEHADLNNRVTKLNNLYQEWKVWFVREAESKLISSILDYLQTTKNQINEKLRELDTIVKEQNGYLARLKDEIEPAIKEKSAMIKKIAAVAEQLSPTSGIPYKYTVRYVNAIFQIANQFIRRVWNYDIELAYFDENSSDSFDFSFKLVINHNSEVKDIKFCSKSQKSVINLAIRLAICIYRGYVNIYPIKFDEIDDGFSPTHRDKLTEFLVELLNQKSIAQAFLVHQSIVVSSSFNDAGMIVLSSDEPLPENCSVKSKVN